MGNPFRYLDRKAPQYSRNTSGPKEPSVFARRVLTLMPFLFMAALVMLLNPTAHEFVTAHTSGFARTAFENVADVLGFGGPAVLAMGAWSSGRQGNQIDLRTQGGVRTVTVAPGSSVQYIHDPQQARVGASSNKPGMYNYVRKYTIQCNLDVTRAGLGEGAEPIYADMFPAAIKSIGLTTPMHGTLIDPSVVDGMVAKHIMEWHQGGYQNPTVKRQPIPATDGSYTRYFELELHYAMYWNEEPDQGNFWLGWLDNGILEMFVNDSADPFNDGEATSITDVTFSVIIETIPLRNILIPPFTVVRRYEQAAGAGSNGPKLQNVGDAGALQGTDDSARLLAMFFSFQAGGFTGSGTCDEIATIQLPWRDQAQTYFASLMIQRYLRDTKLTSLGLDGENIDDLYDIGQEPYPMPGNGSSLTTGTLADPTARFLPLVWPARGNKITQLQRVKGNYPLDGITFSAPQSNVFRVYTLEIKQFSLSKCSEMVTAMGVDPSKAAIVPKTFKGNVPSVSKSFGLPRFVVQKKAA